MESITKIISTFFRGIIDSLKGTLAIFYLDKHIKEKAANETRSPRKNDSARLYPRPSRTPQTPSNPVGQLSPVPEGKILRRTLNCCALNAGLFMMSIILFQYGLLPSVKYCILFIFGHSSVIGNTSWTILRYSLSVIFSILWILPLMLLSKVVNSIWFQDIADHAYRHTRGRPQLPSSIGRVLADVTFSFVIEALFLVQTHLVSYFPIHPLGLFLGLVHNAMLYSLYSFEYKMYNMGWELHKRLYFIEANWPYFIGFGLPLAVLCSLASSYVISGCIFSTLFPFFILSANEATPIRSSVSTPLQLFRPVIVLSNVFFRKSFAPSNVVRRQQTSITSSQLYRDRSTEDRSFPEEATTGCAKTRQL